MWIVDVTYHVLGGDSKSFLTIYAFHGNLQDFKTIQGHMYMPIFHLLLYMPIPAIIDVIHMHNFTCGNIVAPAVVTIMFVV